MTKAVSNRRFHRSRFAILAVVAALAIAGCGQHVDKIGEIDNNPGKYLHQEVTVAGQVTKVYELPLGISNIGAYRLDDGSGQIWVVTHAGAPNEGDKIGLKGTLKPIADMNVGVLGNILGDVIEEHERKAE